VRADDVPSPSQIANLVARQKSRRADVVRGDQEVTRPPGLIEHVRNARVGAHSTVVERKEQQRVLGRSISQLPSTCGLTPAGMRDGPDVFRERGGAQFVRACGASGKPARVELTVVDNVMIKQRDGCHQSSVARRCVSI
jgi:hypothetical protein